MAENTKKQDLATGAELTLEEKINKIKSREITAVSYTHLDVYKRQNVEWK